MPINIENALYPINRGESGLASPQELQDSIRGGEITRMQSTLEQVAVNDPLPNGELPLHFLVREGQYAKRWPIGFFKPEQTPP